jgi:hypothetical protein
MEGTYIKFTVYTSTEKAARGDIKRIKTVNAARIIFLLKCILTRISFPEEKAVAPCLTTASNDQTS